MAHVQGRAHGVRLEREGNEVVLRFVLESEGGERIPVEMRGRKLLGVLSDGDRVRLSTRGASVRGRGRVARPALIENLDTASEIQMAGESCLGSFVKFVGSLLMSVLSGLLTTVAITLLVSQEPETVAYSLEEPSSESFIAPELIVPLLIGLGVAFVVFFLIYLLPRLRRS